MKHRKVIDRDIRANQDSEAEDSGDSDIEFGNKLSAQDAPIILSISETPKEMLYN